jgi:hypothetical protein
LVESSSANNEIGMPRSLIRIAVLPGA